MLVVDLFIIDCLCIDVNFLSVIYFSDYPSSSRCALLSFFPFIPLIFPIIPFYVSDNCQILLIFFCFLGLCSGPCKLEPIAVARGGGWPYNGGMSAVYDLTTTSCSNCTSTNISLVFPFPPGTVVVSSFCFPFFFFFFFFPFIFFFVFFGTSHL